LKKHRLIPVLLLKNGWLVQSKGFHRYQNLGNPTTAVKRLSEWGSDELIYLDISREENYDLRRNDQNYPNRQSFLEIVEDVASVTFMPITVGGKIRTLKQIEERLRLGADKISVNSQAIIQPEFVEQSAREFGSQCIVVSVDAKECEDSYVVYDHHHNQPTNIGIFEFVRQMEERGAGEILLNSVDQDGKGNGYDLRLLDLVASNVQIPVVACGGVGEWHHFKEALESTAVDAVAAANIFHYRDQSVYLAKKYLYESNLAIRKPDLLTLI